MRDMTNPFVRRDPISAATDRDTVEGSKGGGLTENEISKVDSLYQGQYHTARRPLSRENLLGTLVDVLIPAAALYFLIFAWLVYAFRDHPINQEPAPSLLKASQLGPTIFPVVFAAITGRFLHRLAAYKLEEGASVMTLEYLLYSRSVFNALTAPFALRTFNTMTLILIVMWALSPLGGQASLRIVSPGVRSTTVAQNFTYVAYVSPFTNGGPGSTTSNFLPPINAAFMGALFSSAATKASYQDLHGNIKIPIYEELTSSDPADSPTWKPVLSGEETTWSSLTGLPVYGLEESTISRFNLNTAYMKTQCEVSGQDIPYDGSSTPFTRQNFTTLAPNANSGANLAVATKATSLFDLFQFTFYSLADTFTSGPGLLTNATCNVTMRYVEVQVECDGMDCRTLAARPSSNPAIHRAVPLAPLEVASVLNGGLAQDVEHHQHFFSSFVTATDPSLACDTSICTTSGIEGYIADPNNPFTLTETPRLPDVGDALFSQRLGQLMNTYWLDSIAPFAITGNFSLHPNDNQYGTYNEYNTDSTIGTAETRVNVIKCNYAWLAILVISSITLFSFGVASTILSIRRLGPDILDRFSTCLRENPHVHDSQAFSMEDSSTKAVRLRNVIVRLGDVQPNEDVGYVAIAPAESNTRLRQLNATRTYF
ncbi:hypothetical protein RRF57_005830 [Xylaria bambusicola]|uniref:Uncharacterized protein n=1 Tax=Xylaria bambusicola TaxID=326684 RepID=A0AAN7UDA2_9PEZI